jgi:hypothetical protein
LTGKPTLQPVSADGTASFFSGSAKKDSGEFCGPAEGNRLVLPPSPTNRMKQKFHLSIHQLVTGEQMIILRESTGRGGFINHRWTVEAI